MYKMVYFLYKTQTFLYKKLNGEAENVQKRSNSPVFGTEII